MKNSRILILAATVFAISSCLGTGPSTADYILRGTFDYAASDANKKFFKDSLFMNKHINMDKISYVNATYDSEELSEMTSFRGGFLLSMKKDSLGVSPYASANKGAGADNSEVYAVYIDQAKPQYGWQIDFTGYDNYSCDLLGFFVNNTSEVLDAVNKSVNEGDYIKLTVQGYLNDIPGKTAEKYLLDYRNGKKDFITQWTAFELKDFGQVDALSFAIKTNRQDFTPAFCMDSFTAKVHIEY